MEVCCNKFVIPPLLTQEEWKSSGEFEAIILSDTSKLTTIFQNEDKLNGAHGPILRKVLHDGFSCGTVKVVRTKD